LTPPALEFALKLLEADPQKRIKAVTALNDRWLLSIIKGRNKNPTAVVRNLSKEVVNSFILFNARFFLITLLL
jgi:hypothetical protein